MRIQGAPGALSYSEKSFLHCASLCVCLLPIRNWSHLSGLPSQSVKPECVPQRGWSSVGGREWGGQAFYYTALLLPLPFFAALLSCASTDHRIVPLLLSIHFLRVYQSYTPPVTEYVTQPTHNRGPTLDPVISTGLLTCCVWSLLSVW